MNSIKIASGSGFWGDWLLAPQRQIDAGEIQYLILDYLAEVTMSILAKQLQRNPAHGFAKDIVSLVRENAPAIASKNIKVIANAGGMNPRACAEALRDEIKAQGLSISVAVVEGDNILPHIPNLLQAGEQFSHLAQDLAFKEIKDRLVSANAYLGCKEMAEALAAGAQIIITGRVADAAMALAPMVHEFSWDYDDWDRLAAGTIAGHILECGAQASGGNDTFDWQNTPNLADIGYPIVEMYADGSFEVYKHPSLGGRVTRETVIQQLIYEINDPTQYLVPDVIADFTSLSLEEVSQDRIRVTKAKGKERPKRLKVSCSYQAGFMASGSLLYTWPDAVKKAYAATEIVKARLNAVNMLPSRFHAEVLGVDSCFPAEQCTYADQLLEVQMRLAAHDHDRKKVERFSREIAPLVLNGPPLATAYAAGRGKVSEVFAYWPTTIERPRVQATWELCR